MTQENVKVCNKIKCAVLTALSMALLSAGSSAAETATKIEQNTQSYSVTLGATRLIYNPDSSGAVLLVTNQNEYPMLVQSKIVAEDKKTTAPFVITPPLFRLDEHQQSRLRIAQTGALSVVDRESLQWLCVTGIPPESDDAWAADAKSKSVKTNTAIMNIKIKSTNCIKLLVRPSSIKGTMTDAMSSLVWKRSGNKLTVQNPSPFYLSFNSIVVGGQGINVTDYVAPFANATFTLPATAGTSAEVKWKVITDYGGESREYTAKLN